MKIFPVLGGASYAPDYNAVARPGMRRHDGVDVFAPEGTPLLAVDDGVASFGQDPIGGSVVNLRAADGTRYYYAHLARFEGGSRPVRAGELIGYVGRTGNAANTPPHVHFEVRPGGGAPVDPFPLLRGAPVVQRRSITTAAPSPLPGLLLAAGLAGGAYLLSRRTPRRRWAT